MQVFVQMPMDTKFKTGDIVLERGFRIITADDAGKATNDDTKDMFFRPVKPEMVEPEVAEMVVLLELKTRMRALAKEIGKL